MDRILMIDDDPEVLHGYQRSLYRRFNLTVLSDPQEALVMLPTDDFDVVVSDYRMPGMTGLELLSKAKELAPNAVRILLTGVGDWEIALRAVNECNVFRFISKPVDADFLYATLQDALEQSRLNRIVSEELRRQGHEPTRPVSICSYCKSIRTSEADARSAASWEKLEIALGKRFGVQFSHGICPECAARIIHELNQH